VFISVCTSRDALRSLPRERMPKDSVPAASPDYVRPGPNLPTGRLAALRHARQTKGLAIVPGQGSSPLPPRLQALIAALGNISGLHWIQLRQSFGGRDSCFASRETMRKAVAAVSKEPGRQVRMDERGVHLVELHSALECLTEELWSSGQWADRFIRDVTGSKVTHTEAFLPTPPGQPYTLHSDLTADFHLCVEFDKGGRGTPTSKLVAAVANQACP